MGGRSYQTEAVVLRSMRLGEADRVLHLYTYERGRVGAVAKGIRKTTSRFGARLEPLSQISLQLHQGGGELQTITGVDLIASHRATREDRYRLSVGLIAAEAMLKLYSEQEGDRRAFTALTRFLDELDGLEPVQSDPALEPLVLSLQLKLLWVAGYLPHLTSCASCAATGSLVAYSPVAGGAVCPHCSAGAMPLAAESIAGMEELIRRPLAEARAVGLGVRDQRQTLAVIMSSYEFHGGFRLRTVSA